MIRFSALGDIAMVVPVVYSLATQYPHLHVTVLSRGFARPLFEDLAPNISFMEADIKKEYHGVKGLNALYRRLAAKHFTKIADLHNVLRSEYLRLRFNMGAYRVEHINKHRHMRRRLVSNNNKVREQLPTSFQNYADVFAKLGYPIKLQFTSLFPPEGGNLNLLPAIFGPKKSFEQWIGIAPTAAHPGKVYPYPLMEQVIKNLITSASTAPQPDSSFGRICNPTASNISICNAPPRRRFFLFGRGVEEDRLFTRWHEAMPECLPVSKHTENLHQELIVMSHLDVMISMDSANMHLASLTGTPVVSIWGATHPYAGFMGYSQPPQNAIQVDSLDCRPCSIYGQKACQRRDLACMNRITPERIVSRVEEILATT